MIPSFLPTLTSPWVIHACRLIHENKTWKALGVEVLGVNLPKVTIVRTKNEALDVGVNQFGNTLGFFGGIWAGSSLLKRIPLHPDPAVISKGRVMKSFVLIPPLVAFMVAMPFFRNAFTAWYTGTTDYQDLVTKPSKGQGIPLKEREKARRIIRENSEKGATILSVGLLVGLMGFLWSRSLGSIRMFRGAKLVPALDKTWFRRLIKAFCLTGPKATEFDNLRAVLYWGVPAYMGWIAASRDRSEIKEQLLKMANFIAAYMLTDKLINRYFEKWTSKYALRFPALYSKSGRITRFSYTAWQRLKPKMNPRLAKEVVRFENGKLLSGFGLTALLMAMVPALLKYLSRRSPDAKAQANRQSHAQAYPAARISYPSGPWQSGASSSWGIVPARKGGEIDIPSDFRYSKA